MQKADLQLTPIAMPRAVSDAVFALTCAFDKGPPMKTDEAVRKIAAYRAVASEVEIRIM